MKAFVVKHTKRGLVRIGNIEYKSKTAALMAAHDLYKQKWASIDRKLSGLDAAYDEAIEVINNSDLPE